MAYEILGAEELISGESLVGGGQSDLALGAYEILAGMKHGGHRGDHGHRQSREEILREAAYIRQAQSGSVVRQAGATRSRRQVLPMASIGVVQSGTTQNITARPQSFAFRPEKIVIPATIAPDFTLSDIKVGVVSQMVQSGELPAEAFVQNSYDTKMEMDTVQTSQDFVLIVNNISGADRTFRAAVFGRSLNQ